MIQEIILPLSATATEGDYVYLSISYDGQYIEDKNGNSIVYIPVALEDIEAVDLTVYGLDNIKPFILKVILML